MNRLAPLALLLVACTGGFHPAGFEPDAGYTGPAPAVPSGLAIVRDPLGVALRWSAVPGATQYLVRAQWSGGENVGATAGTTLRQQYSVARGAVRYSVASSNGAASAFSDAVEVPAETPLLEAVQEGQAIRLNWTRGPATGLATVLKGPPLASPAPLYTGSANTLLDAAVSRVPMSYVLSCEGSPVSFLSNTVTASLALAAPANLAVSYPWSTGFSLKWDPVAGASSYELWFATAQAGPFSQSSTLYSSPVAASCPGGARGCWVAVRARDSYGTSALSTPAPASTPPAAPLPAVTSGSDGILVSVPFVPTDATRVVTARGPSLTGPFVDVGDLLPGLEWLDTSAAPWTPFFYRTRSINQYGVERVSSDIRSGFRTEVASPVNLAAATGRSTAYRTGQTFVVTRAGQLMGFEVESSSVSEFELRAQGRVLATGLRPAIALVGDLDPARMRGAYLDLSASGLSVSAGEQLAFDTVGSPAITGDSYSDGAGLQNGAADPAHDLRFKVYVRATADLVTPDPVLATPGARAMRLDWRGSSGAVAYRVTRSLAASPPEVLATTQQISWTGPATESATYGVEAVDAAGLVAASQPVTAAPLPFAIDQENRGDVPSAWAVGPLCPQQPGTGFDVVIGQSFTVGVSGTLAAFEVAVSDPAKLRAELWLNGVLVGSVVQDVTADSRTFPARPLYESAPRGGLIDLRSLGRTVTAGETYSVLLKAAPGSPCISMRYAPQSYPGGSISMDGTVYSNDDLVFRTYVAP